MCWLCMFEVIINAGKYSVSNLKSIGIIVQFDIISARLNKLKDLGTILDFVH